MAIARPDRAVDDFGRAIVIAVGVEIGRTGEQRAIGGCQRGDVGIGAVPPKVVVVVADFEFAGEARRPGVHPVGHGSGGVLVQGGVELLIGVPDEVGLVEPRDIDAPHNMVASAVGGVVAAFERDQAVDHHGLRDGVIGDCRARRGNDRGPRILGQQLAREAGGRNRCRGEQRNEVCGGQLVGCRRQCAVTDELFERARKEQAIAQHGSANLISELVLIVLGAAEPSQIVLKIGRIEGCIFQIFVADAVIPAAAGASHGVGDESAGAAVLGGIVVGRDAVFLDGFGRDGVERPGDQVIVVFDAIEKVIGRRRTGAIHADAEPARRAVVGGNVRQAHQHGVDVAALQGQVFDLFGIDDVRHGCVQRAARALLSFERTRAAGVDVRAVEGDDGLAAGEENAAVLARFPDIAQRAKLELDLDAAGDRQIELLQFLSLEARGGGTDRICSSRKQREKVITVRIALVCAAGRERGAFVCDRCAGNGPAGYRVEDGAGNQPLRGLRDQAGDSICAQYRQPDESPLHSWFNQCTVWRGSCKA